MSLNRNCTVLDFQQHLMHFRSFSRCSCLLNRLSFHLQFCMRYIFLLLSLKYSVSEISMLPSSLNQMIRLFLHRDGLRVPVCANFPECFWVLSFSPNYPNIHISTGIPQLVRFWVPSKQHYWKNSTNRGLIQYRVYHSKLLYFNLGLDRTGHIRWIRICCLKLW